jgi:carbon-monoxide dehydrogenase medium subunit
MPRGRLLKIGGVNAITYSRPRTVSDAIDLLGSTGARPFAGGTDLLIQLRGGARRAEHLVDVKDIDELGSLEYSDAGGLRLGAAVPCWRLGDSAEVRRRYPGLVESAELIGSTQIQSRATIGGNLCNSSPAADTTPALIAIGARCVIAGPSGRREVAVEDFVTAPGQNVLGHGELLVELRAPPPGPATADCYRRLIPRNEMDIAVVGVGAQVRLDGERCTAARIGLGAVAATPLVARAAAEAIVGRVLDDAALAAAAAAARAAARPISDMRGTIEYRREVVGVLTRRVIAEAARRAGSRGEERTR